MSAEAPAHPHAVPSPTSISWFEALRRGFRHRCPRCGEGDIRQGFLAIRPTCARCGLDLAAYRVDDAPPYFTIFIVGHLVIPSVLMVERMWAPALWLQAALWVPLALALTLALLPRVKGAVLGVHFAAGIEG